MEKTIALTLQQAAILLNKGETIMVKGIPSQAAERRFFQAFTLSDIKDRDMMEEEEILHYLKSYYQQFEFWK